MTSTRSAAATGLPIMPRRSMPPKQARMRGAVLAKPEPAPDFLDPALLPEIYGMGVSGGCMEPDFPDGCRIKVSRLEPYAHGDIVTVWFRPELIKPGGVPALIKRVVMMPPPWVKAFPYRDHPQSDVLALLMLGTNDRPNEALQVRCADVIAVHKVLGILQPGESYQASKEPFMRRRAQ